MEGLGLSLSDYDQNLQVGCGGFPEAKAHVDESHEESREQSLLILLSLGNPKLADELFPPIRSINHKL